MRERGILFQGPMVRALLAGTKTQTRRAVKPAPPAIVSSVYRPYAQEPNNWQGYADRDGLIHWYGRCPYGEPGDHLWVRERSRWGGFDPAGDWETAAICYAADDAVETKTLKHVGMQAPYKTFDYARNKGWLPPIHMPRWASRILLEVTEVRVERLQDISEEDAKAEGIHKPVGSQFWHSNDLAHLWDKGGGLPGETPQHAYRNLWERINGDGSWAANPFVWAVSFRRIKP